jgi:hypothetical protein
MRENHFGAPHAFSEFFLSSPCHPFLCPLLLSLSYVLCPLSHVFVLCLSSYVPCSLSLVLCPLCHVSVPCLPSAVPCLTSLILVPHASSIPCLTALLLVSRPLYTVSHDLFLSPIFLSPSPDRYQLSQCPLCVALFHCSCPLLLCFLSSVPSSLFLCPLSFILSIFYL